MSVKSPKISTVGSFVFLLAAVLVLSGCQTEPEQAAPLVEIDGSETVFPLLDKAATEFQASRKVRVVVNAVGTGRGLKRFCRGETDLATASRPIESREMVACQAKGINFLELPIAYDAITVVINPGNNWATQLKLADLKKMWAPEAQGKIVSWKDARADFPDAPLRMFAVTASSGTYDYFTKVINGKAKLARNDVTVIENDSTIIKGVSADENAIGFLGYAYYAANNTKLKAVAIDSGKGAVLPSIATVSNGTYTPFSRPLFIYVSSKSLAKPRVKEFVNYYLTNAEKLAIAKKYIPLPATAYTRIQARANAQKFGSEFGGKAAIGLKIQDVADKIAR
jgi:phosphate transport system substrate-binding protein